jgi:hypothetical protein
MYVGGVVYKLMYTERVADRMEPEDVWPVNWESLIKVTRILMRLVVKIQDVIRLDFSPSLVLSRGANPRLGGNSPARVLDPEMFRLVWSFV